MTVLVMENMACRVDGSMPLKYRSKHHLTPVQDQKCIGVGAAQHLVERPGTPVSIVDGQVVEVDPRLGRGGHGERLGRAGSRG